MSEQVEIVVEKLAFEGPKSGPDRGFTIKSSYLSKPEGEALIEILRNGEPYRRFLYPAYKIWNLAAHFGDIVTSEIEGNFDGYDMAGWTGFSVVSPVSHELPHSGLHNQAAAEAERCPDVEEG